MAKKLKLLRERKKAKRSKIIAKKDTAPVQPVERFFLLAMKEYWMGYGRESEHFS